MKHSLVITVLLMSVGACSERTSDAASYKRLWDRAVVQFGFGPPCFRKEKTPHGEILAFIGNEECFRFDPPKRMRGIWLEEFESSEFLPNATQAPAEWHYSKDAIWLDLTRPEPLLTEWNGQPRAFAVEFIGRKATFPGRYGHMGGSRHLVVVKRLLSASPVPPPNSSS